MGLLLNDIIQLNSGNSSITIFDVTGDYSVSNTGGWGTPNPETTDVTKATLTVSVQGYNTLAPVTVDITANFADLFTVNGLNLTAQQLLNVPVLPDGWYTFTYSVVALGIEYDYTSEQAFYGNVQCCVKKAVSNLDVPVTDVKKVSQTYYVSVLFDALTSNACCNNQANYLAILKELNRVCGGCGDSTFLNSPDNNSSPKFWNGCQGGGCQ